MKLGKKIQDKALIFELATTNTYETNNARNLPFTSASICMLLHHNLNP